MRRSWSQFAREMPGPGTELASYWVSGGERLLVWAAVDCYLAQANRLDAPPMSSEHWRG